MCYIYNGILALKRKDILIHAIMLRKLGNIGTWKQVRQKRTNIIEFHLYEVSTRVIFIETENRLVVTVGWEEE